MTFPRLCALVIAFEAIAATAAPISLFDGRTLDQWESIAAPIGGVPMWRVEGGLITGGSLTEQIAHNDFLATTKSYGNFELRLFIKITGTSGFVNSGIQVRSQRAKSGGEMVGYQVDAGEGWWGKLYDESRRNKVIGQAANLEAVNAAVKKNDWNEFIVRAEGPRLRSWINGVAALDYIETDPAIPLSGRIGIQVHGGGKTLVQVKDVTIEELPEPKPGEIFIGAPPSSIRADHKSAAQSAQDQLGTFNVPPGFEIQLVAAEIPDVAGKFITVVFDQKGRMWTMTAFEYPVDANENKAVADALYGSPGKDKVLVYDNVFGAIPPEGLKPRVWADGLAIPLGLLPYKDGAYVQHGPDITFLRDSDDDGKADKREVILTGFGVQDSHLFPHQFMRAPGGWIWMAQGAFNYGKVRKPNDRPEEAIQFDQTRMARFRPDGSGFDITSQGPCNIWGLVINGEGEAFIQEANDLGYPVMPFHEYANYPGCSDRQWKSYAPEFPGTAPGFRMGGTGLSGLALSDARGAWPGAYADVMYVANPITRQIQAIKMHRDGPRWRLEKLPDFINSNDPRFRPVAITFGPDGCLYIVDWYNEIISHNEVARNHPDRDKTRGRIWRVKHKEQTPFKVPDFTVISSPQLLEKLGGESLAQSQLAWQAIVDRKSADLIPPLLEIIAPTKGVVLNSSSGLFKPVSRFTVSHRIAALWALEGLGALEKLNTESVASLIRDTNRNVRRETIRALEPYFAEQAAPAEGGLFRSTLVGGIDSLLIDNDPEVRAEMVKAAGRVMETTGKQAVPPPARDVSLKALLKLGREPLPGPIANSTQNNRPIKVGDAYDREFERYLVRGYLERQPQRVAAFLDSAEADKLPIEALLLASLALEPKASAPRVAKLIPQLQRAPGQEEVLRLAQFPDEPGVGDALRAALTNEKTRNGVLDALLATRTRLDAGKLTPMLSDTGKGLLESRDDGAIQLGVRLADEFKLAILEPQLVKLAGEQADPARVRSVIRALGSIESRQVDLLAKLAESSDVQIRDEAIAALGSSRSAAGGEKLLGLWPKLDSNARRNALDRLTGRKPGAKAVVAALKDGRISKPDLDAAAFEKLQTVLGPNDPDLAPLVGELTALFRPVLALNGQDNAWSETNQTLDGPFTVECWIRLDSGIDNNDGILGVPGQLDINFFDAKVRVWVGGGMNDSIVSKKPITAQVWTHVAVTRDVGGRFKLYQDGELVADQSKAAPQKFENVRIAWTQPGKGTAGALSEFRIWKEARSAEVIRRDFDRSYSRLPEDGNGAAITGLAFASSTDGWGKPQPGAQIVKSNDFPPVMTAAEAKAHDDKFAKFRSLAEKRGDASRGKTSAALCQACHLFKGQGASIGPDLSGVGAMGVEGILRNILTPNAAMENAYRIYRVELMNGELIDSFFVSEDKDAVVVRLPGAPDRRIPRTEIRNAKYLRRSLMPEGMLDGMTEEHVSDLFAYLLSLK